MNYEAIEAHLETHREVMALIRSKVPEKKTFSFGHIYTLQDVIVDNDGDVKAEYSRYVGCGDYEHEIEYLNVRSLLEEKTE